MDKYYVDKCLGLFGYGMSIIVTNSQISEKNDTLRIML